MNIASNMKPFEMVKFLEEDVKTQIAMEIASLLYIGNPAGGYFGVTREICCMIDFLGALHFGYNKKGEKKRIATQETFLKFLSDILSEIDEFYKSSALDFYLLYRHGLIHLNAPKEYELDDGRILTWMPYKGGRVDVSLQISGLEFNGIRHLERKLDSRVPQKVFLPISINCLYYDLIASVDIFIRRLKTDPKLRDKWNSTAKAISDPEKYSVYMK